MYGVPCTATMRHPLAETMCVGRPASSASGSSPQSAVKRLLPVDAPVGRSASARSRQLRWSASSGGASSSSAPTVVSSSSTCACSAAASDGGGAASRPRPKNRENAMAKRGRVYVPASILGVVAARSVEAIVARDEVAWGARRDIGRSRALHAPRPLEKAHDLERDGSQEGDLSCVGSGAEGQRADRAHDVLGIPRLEELDRIERLVHLGEVALELLGRRGGCFL